MTDEILNAAARLNAALAETSAVAHELRQLLSTAPQTEPPAGHRAAIDDDGQYLDELIADVGRYRIIFGTIGDRLAAPQSSVDDYLGVTDFVNTKIFCIEEKR